MNPNQNLIDYQNELLQNNLDQINFLNFQILSVKDAISSANDSITYYNGQIDDITNQINALTAGNVLINDTIVILTGV